MIQLIFIQIVVFLTVANLNNVYASDELSLSLEEIVKDGGGYKIENLKVDHNFEKFQCSVVKDAKGRSIVLSGLALDGASKIELSIHFNEGVPISYAIRKWKKSAIDEDNNHENIEMLIDAKSGFVSDVEGDRSINGKVRKCILSLVEIYKK